MTSPGYVHLGVSLRILGFIRVAVRFLCARGLTLKCGFRVRGVMHKNIVTSSTSYLSCAFVQDAV